jgi:hypothetical protein
MIAGAYFACYFCKRTVVRPGDGSTTTLSSGEETMYAFAVVILLGLALFKVVDLLEDLVPALTKYHSLVNMALAIAGMFALDYSAVGHWDTTFSQDWHGTAVTGLFVAGCTSVWRAVFHYLGSSEGDAPEVRHPLTGPRSMAA